MTTFDRHASRLADLRRAVLEGHGATDRALRAAAASGFDVPEPLAGYAATVRDASYQVSDADIAALKAAGHSEEEIFELTVAAALGAAVQRLEAGLRAVVP